jgi:hypothetical protein
MRTCIFKGLNLWVSYQIIVQRYKLLVVIIRLILFFLFHHERLVLHLCLVMYFVWNKDCFLPLASVPLMVSGNNGWFVKRTFLRWCLISLNNKSIPARNDFHLHSLSIQFAVCKRSFIAERVLDQVPKLRSCIDEYCQFAIEILFKRSAFISSKVQDVLQRFFDNGLDLYPVVFIDRVLFSWYPACEPPFSLVQFHQHQHKLLLTVDICFYNRHIHFRRSLFRGTFDKNRKSTFPLSSFQCNLVA